MSTHTKKVNMLHTCTTTADAKGAELRSTSLPLSWRLRKNILGKILDNGITIQFLSPQIRQFIHDFQHILLSYYDRITTEKIIKWTLRLLSKIATIYMCQIEKRGEDAIVLKTMMDVEDRLRTIILTMSSFNSLSCSYHYDYLKDRLLAANEVTKNLIMPYLHDRSIEKLDFIFDRLTMKPFVDGLFENQSDEMKSNVETLCNHLQDFLD